MDKTTYIIGAGFSRAAGLPLMNDFYFRSKDIYPSLNEKEKKSFDIIFDYFDRFSKVKNIMNADFYNIEELLSIIEMDALINANRKIKKHYLTYLQKVIEHVSQEFNSIRNVNKITKSYLKFLQDVYGLRIKLNEGLAIDYYIRDENNDNGIISLNYDLILEQHLEKINSKNQPYRKFDDVKFFDFNYGINEKYVNFTQEVPPEDRVLKLAKIHGSINFIKRNLPLIVPPTWNKTSAKEMIPVWKLAHDLIAQANKLVFIGYSLPPTDLYVKYLLINGIKNCNNLKKIIVINPPPKSGKDVIEERYHKFFDENFQQKAFEYTGKKFQDYFKSDSNA